MTISSWRNTALASLLSSVVVVAGQQVIFIPLSSSTTTGNNNMNMESFLFGSGGDDYGGVAAEPPCRQRRLAPWRQNVREQCRIEAESHCSRPGSQERELLLRREEDASSYITLMSMSSPRMTLLEKEMDSFFEDLFAQNQRSSPSSSGLQRKDPSEEEDPFELLFHDMLGFSLRAFDQMTIMDVASPAAAEVVVEEEAAEAVREENQEEEEEAAVARTVARLRDEYWDDDADDDVVGDAAENAQTDEEVPAPRAPPSESWDSGSRDYLTSTDVAATPEQAAENALDVMVASLARSAVAAAKEAAAREEEEEEELAGSSIPSVDNLPQLLFVLGNDLLVESHSRRRLLEEGGEILAADPHLQVKERLARRLTEYRTDLLYSTDGTVTLYTTTSHFPSTSFVSAAPPSPFEQVSPALGMGSGDLDDCVRSRFDNDDLEGGCHRAVGEFLLAVDRGSPESPHYKEFGARTVPEIMEQSDEEVRVPNNVWNAVVFAAMFLGVALMVEKYLDGAYEEESEDDDDANEFDYTSLPEDDAEERPVRNGGTRVFVGVPVQVV